MPCPELRLNALLYLAFGLAALTAPAPHGVTALRFSDAAPGTQLPAGWHDYAMSRHKPAAAIRLVRDDGVTVLHIDADHDAGAIAYPLDLPAATRLRWRWKVDHSVAAADMNRRSGDDFAARVYVFFDVPRSHLSLYQRMKLSLAQRVLGHPMPTAAICYVWDNRHAVGTIAPSPFFSGMRTIVLQSGNAHAGIWQTESRDLAADFRAAFGHAAPHITGIALAADTDNTGGKAQAWFGDLQLAPQPASKTPPAANTP
ncbi:hypothetical protein LF63_0108705 [Oleiagrimonas soli]|uniref:DUF3047 domain-containing protein n=1 Tax=Oleiagrimonas soli TaxID=1543381 RepID=A0A099CXE7_9GAMM|nr:hypothetical protein LF63_0108705 [Oleiagrimonas soli]